MNPDRVQLGVLTIALLAVISGCAAHHDLRRNSPGDLPHLTWTTRDSGSTAGLRGIAVVSPTAAWATGSEATVLRTTDGGDSWRQCTVAEAPPDADFRDVHAFSADRAIIMAVGAPARFWKTDDGGETWRIVYENHAPGIFFDAIAFWNARDGIALGDPLERRFVIVTTTDGGDTWTHLPENRAPLALPDEHAFAASGSCLAVQGDAEVRFGAGGAVARVMHSADRGKTWSAAEVPLGHGSASTGVFSLMFFDRERGVAVGGDYEQPDQRAGVAAYTANGGRTWHAVTDAPPSGYRSCVARLTGVAGGGIAVGSNGVDVSLDFGKSWRRVREVGYHAIAIGPRGSGYAVGPEGRIATVQIHTTAP